MFLFVFNYVQCKPFKNNIKNGLILSYRLTYSEISPYFAEHENQKKINVWDFKRVKVLYDDHLTSWTFNESSADDYGIVMMVVQKYLIVNNVLVLMRLDSEHSQILHIREDTYSQSYLSFHYHLPLA